MSRKDDLEQSISESKDLIHEYQAILRELESPEAKARAQREIAEQRELIKEYEAELDALRDSAVRDPSAETNATTEVWDVFISHASEDKGFSSTN